MVETLREAVLGHQRSRPEALFVRCLMPDGSVAPVTYADLVSRGSQLAWGSIFAIASPASRRKGIP